jgi:hypothetical protein
VLRKRWCEYAIILWLHLCSLILWNWPHPYPFTYSLASIIRAFIRFDCAPVVKHCYVLLLLPSNKLWIVERMSVADLSVFCLLSRWSNTRLLDCLDCGRKLCRAKRSSMFVAIFRREDTITKSLVVLVNRRGITACSLQHPFFCIPLLVPYDTAAFSTSTLILTWVSGVASYLSYHKYGKFISTGTSQAKLANRHKLA